MRNNQTNWLLAVSAVVLMGAAVVTLRAAEHGTPHAAVESAVRDLSANATDMRAGPGASLGIARGGPASNIDALATPGAVPATSAAASHLGAPAGGAKQHPPASAPEESATIADDPTTAPDPSQSADNNVSFPTDI